MASPSDLEDRLDRLRSLEVEAIADAIQSIGFACTRCGACCRGHGTDHVATVFPDEVRQLAASNPSYDWRDVARPLPFGLAPDGSGETVEWALQIDGCGDCEFLEEHGDGSTACGVYDDRPSICRTYPFTLELMPGGRALGEAVERVGPVVAHECEGLGEPIDRTEARDLAEALKHRGETALEEAIAVRDHLRSERPSATTAVVDSEGVKRPDGTPVDGSYEG